MMATASSERATLSSSERAQLRRTFADLASAEGYRPIGVELEPLPSWPVIAAAVRRAGDATEMAVLRVMEISDHERRFVMRTINERPAELLTRREPDEESGEVFVTATARVGLFGNDHGTAQRLVDAFEGALRAQTDRERERWRRLGYVR